MRYRAAVLHAFGAPLSIEEITLETLADDDVLIRLGASGLCHSDLEVIRGSLPLPLPIVLGHEGAGTVERIGRGVSQVAPGDRVVCSWNPSCGHCFYCERDQPILCEPVARHAPEGLLPDGRPRYSLSGQRVHHFTSVSSHAEYCVVPQAGAVKVSDDIAFDRACLIGCGVMTGVGAVIRLARVEAGASVAVIGAGAVGLNAVQGAVLAQAETIFAVDRDPDRLAMARSFGATHTLRADEDDVIDSVRSATLGRGADYVFECAGNEASMRLSLETVRRGGLAVILGKTQVNDHVSLRFGSLMGEKRIIRSSYGGARPRRDFPWLATLYLEGKLRLDELITRRISLDQINEGFAAMSTGQTIRSVVTLAS